MEKFTNKINEEFFKLGKKTTEKQYTKSTPQLIEYYCRNLVTGDKLSIRDDENFDFKFYRVYSITKESIRKYIVVFDTFDESHNPLNKITYYIEI